MVAQLSAWGDYGPWSGRRGFDSLVQVATGIAEIEGSAERPGALPAQALDHGTGYLLAAAVLRSLTEQAREGGTRLVRLALARTAAWLMDGSAHRDEEPADTSYEPGPWLAETDSDLGRLRYARSPVSFAGGPFDWARPPGRWGRTRPGGPEPAGRFGRRSRPSGVSVGSTGNVSMGGMPNHRLFPCTCPVLCRLVKILG